jgi:hypothetical protein
LAAPERIDREAASTLDILEYENRTLDLDNEIGWRR